MLHFIKVGVTGIPGGKKLKNVEMVKKIAEKPLTKTPALPNRKGPYCTGSCLIFLIMKRMMGIKYEIKRPASVSETMALKATVLPEF